jgi:hypothetical protein
MWAGESCGLPHRARSRRAQPRDGGEDLRKDGPWYRDLNPLEDHRAAVQDDAAPILIKPVAQRG